jgi:RNA polymerase sigma factor (sigma-70 family)
MSQVQPRPNQPGSDVLSRHDTLSRHDKAFDEDNTAHALLDSLAQGNSRAFWDLWSLYRGYLYHICLSHMDGVREDAEDALSRSMLRAIDKLPHIGPRIENIRAWLGRLTVNLCADMHRERKRRARRVEPLDDVLPNLGESLPADADSPEEVILHREAYAGMCDAVNELPDRLREPFAMRFFQEMAYVDIAERLMLSNENVRKRIQQARDVLKSRVHKSPPPSVLSGGMVSTRRHTRGDAAWQAKDTKGPRTDIQRPKRTTTRL